MVNNIVNSYFQSAESKYSTVKHPADSKKDSDSFKQVLFHPVITYLALSGKRLMGYCHHPTGKAGGHVDIKIC